MGLPSENATRNSAEFKAESIFRNVKFPCVSVCVGLKDTLLEFCRSAHVREKSLRVY